MQWYYNETTECYTDDTFRDYRGAYGYKLIPYVEKWSIYFCNGWRTQRPLGEYINNLGMNSSVFAMPSLGLPEELLLDTLQEAQFIASMHKESGVDPEGSQDEDQEETEAGKTLDAIEADVAQGFSLIGVMK